MSAPLDVRERLAEALHAMGDCRRCQAACENQWPCASAYLYRESAAHHLLPVVTEAVQQARAEVEAVVTEWLDESRDHYTLHGLPRMVSLGAAATLIRAALQDGGAS